MDIMPGQNRDKIGLDSHYLKNIPIDNEQVTRE